MKRTALKRTSWMKRSTTRTKPKRKNKYARRPRGKAYLAWLHSGLPCMVTVIGAYDEESGGVLLLALPCSGPIQADHAGERIAGMGTRSMDRDCIPVCEGHHGQLTEYKGLFADRAFRKRWRTAAIAATQELALRAGVEIPDA